MSCSALYNLQFNLHFMCLPHVKVHPTDRPCIMMEGYFKLKRQSTYETEYDPIIILEQHTHIFTLKMTV